MYQGIFCAVIILAAVVGGHCAHAGNRYIGNWSLILPNGGPGWLGITHAEGHLDAGIFWGGGSARPVSSIRVEGNRLVAVVLNGKTIIDNEPLLGCAGGALWSDPMKPGPLYLQGNHGAASFRSIVLTPILKE